MNLTVGLILVVFLLFAVTGTVKIVGLSASLKIRDHLGLPPRLWQVVGALETSGAIGTLVGLWYRPLGIAATAGLAALMLGAIVSRLRVRDTVLAVLSDVLVLAVVTTLLVLYALA